VKVKVLSWKTKNTSVILGIKENKSVPITRSVGTVESVNLPKDFVHSMI